MRGNGATRLKLKREKTDILLLEGTSNRLGGMISGLDGVPLQCRGQAHNLGVQLPLLPPLHYW